MTQKGAASEVVDVRVVNLRNIASLAERLARPVDQRG